ncbi:M14 family zinc carboxypeptidase [Streptomyces yaizuensis]|uniref:Succinylglutamate desuccinylase/aspartoacylase family protein n=1 Tax=Streptomyces yaizuensis TaxID=2989713 RepID=A0ABQ5NU08_9ACTN|nr:M14 family zinc carboxypeptidase [Streptomyces sp. YSPA8]GLF93850.1 succinylglutamate desuccinylase/aspartoacylase family protein [Streptomyces sp. YSPA8]
MGISRPVLAATAALTGVVLLAPVPATAVPGQPPQPEGTHPVRDRGNADPVFTKLPRAAAAAEAPAARSHQTGTAYPRRTVLTVPPVNAADKSIKLGLAPYHSLAPRLNELQKLGDRVSVELAGKSATGRDLYLVTVTAPESAAQVRDQERMRERIENSPASAARDRRIAATYKTPVFFNNNIHGNEWEGTDAALKLIEELAKANDAKTRELLAKNRIHLNVSANPDGRVAGTRANAQGFDLNRDFITATQPETRAIRKIAIEKQPAVMLDLHGYVNGTLIEPTTPPHGENYEYDLFLKNSYANALGMEKAVNALGYTEAKDGVRPAEIPFRDWAEGWDDWPPIFTPQYMPFQGAVASHTIEFPMRVNNRDYDALPVAELRRRSAINTDIAGAAMRATLEYTRTHRGSLIADQIETFRRGAAGEAQRTISPETVPGVPGIGPEDVYTATFPRAYVIPAGRGQRSAVAAARLVDHLVANDVRVERAVLPFRLDGTVHAAGSYVVDMRQPKRGIANVMLADGRDISADVAAMYDISGWSLGRLWGATVHRAERGELRLLSRTVREAAPTGSVAHRGDLRLELSDPKELEAVNALLAQGVAVRRTGDGAAIVAASARTKAERLAERLGVRFTAARERGTTALERTRVAASVTAGELFALREMGFDVVPVSTSVLNAGFDWKGVDSLIVSTGLSHAALTPAARDAFTRSGVGVVGVGTGGAAFTGAAGLLDATAVAGNGDANGVVRVVNKGGTITGGTQPHAFVYEPVWFTGLGKGVRVDQAYGGGNPLLSGHWRATADGTGGPADAAGKPSVVSGTSASGVPVTLFGTEPLFRSHPKGTFAQVGRALLNH